MKVQKAFHAVQGHPEKSNRSNIFPLFKCPKICHELYEDLDLRNWVTLIVFCSTLYICSDMVNSHCVKSMV